MNTQHQPGAQLSHLRHMMQSMSAATLSSVDEHGVLLNSSISRWEMDNCAALWLFTDPQCPPSVHLQSINLSFADAAGTRRVSLSGRVEVCAEHLPSNVQALPSNAMLLKFTPQSVVYWHAQQSLITRLFMLLKSAFSAKVMPASLAVDYVELPATWPLDAQEQAA